MTIPLIGLGHDLLIGDLVEFVVEPDIPEGVQYAERDFSGDGTIHERGAFCVALWAVLDGVDVLDELLAQMGLDDDDDQRNAVTAYLPTRRSKWHLYNGYAIFPQTLTYAFGPTNLRIMFNFLTQIG